MTAIRDIQIHSIAKSLEEERNYAIKTIDKKNLRSRVRVLQINNFYSTYTLTMSDDGLPDDNTTALYREFYRTRFNASRYLLELFLTSLEFTVKESLIFSLAMSEKINNHAIDKLILSSQPTNPDFLKKVDNNKVAYKTFINAVDKPSTLVPYDLEVFFPTNGLDPLKSRGEGRKFIDEFGFEYHKHAKLNYSNIIAQNHRLDDMFGRLQKAKVFNKFTGKPFLRSIYSLLSSEMHPSLSALETFEMFISKNDAEKKSSISNRKETNDTFLKVVGILMDLLYKEDRGSSLADLKY